MHQKHHFATLALAILLAGLIFSAFVPGAAAIFSSFAMAVVGVVTAYLGSHVAAQHSDNITRSKPDLSALEK